MAMPIDQISEEKFTREFYEVWFKPKKFLRKVVDKDWYYGKIAPMMAEEIVIGPGCKETSVGMIIPTETLTLAKIAHLSFVLASNGCVLEDTDFEAMARRALQLEDTKALDALIKLGVGLHEEEDITGFLPIHRISFTGNVKLLDVAVEAGADINARADIHKKFYEELPPTIGITPLHIAVIEDNCAIAKRLIELGCEFDVQDSRGYTPYLYAVQNNHLEIADLLLAKGAAPGGKDENGQTALHKMVESGDLNRVKALLETGYPVDTVNKNGKTALYWGISHCHSKKNDNYFSETEFYRISSMIDVLLEAGADVCASGKSGFTALHWAIGNCQTRDNYSFANPTGIYGISGIVDILLRAGADVHAKCQEYMRWGLQGCDEERICHSEVQPIHLAAISKNLEIVNSLIDRGALANVQDSQGATPLIYLIATNRLYADSNVIINIIRKLVAHGANVNIAFKGNNNNTLLHYAASSWQKGVVHELLSLGALPNVSNAHGDTPLHIAAYSYLGLEHTNDQPNDSCTEVIAMLIEKGADFNAQNETGETPLHMAVHKHCIHRVEKLINAGCDVNRADNNGKTPLFRAVEFGDIDCVQKLIDAGCDVNRSDNNGVTPLQIAQRDLYYDKENMIELLQAHSASCIIS